MQSFIPLHPKMFHTLIIGSKYEIIYSYNFHTNYLEVDQKPIYETRSHRYIATLTKICLDPNGRPQIEIKDDKDIYLTIAGAWILYEIRQL